MDAAGRCDLHQIITVFFAEAREMLAAMEKSLLALEKDPGDTESINLLFRSVHTIKGSSGMFDLDAIVRFTHTVENVLDCLRQGSIRVDETLTGILLESHDYIGRLIDMYEQDPNAKPAEDLRLMELYILGRLQRYDRYPDAVPGPPENPEPPESAPPGDSDNPVASNHWHISLRFGADVFRNGLDPRSFISCLAEKGRVLNIVMLEDRLPGLADIDPESCYLGFEIAFEGSASKKDILDVFDFVRDDCDIRVLPPKSSIVEYVKLINELNEPHMSLGEILTRVGSLTEPELETALSLQDAGHGDVEGGGKRPLLGAIMVEEKMVDKPVLEAALVKQKDMIRAEDRKSKSLRIEADKLDDLINYIGELVITGSNVRQLADRQGDAALTQSISTMSRLIEDVRDRIMNIGMVQIGDTFRRFERLVRDLGHESGKEIDLVITGGDTELDKTIVERITDPLMHLVRNSVDHGIDVPEERVRKGKSRRGTISINAFHETGTIVIEIRDDGNGLNRERIRATAIEKGFISSTQELTDQELFHVIFEPGFSTADKVTNISGRGVGMDVVKRNIEALRGAIFIESAENEGVMIRIQLPLTLAIIDGFMFTVNGSYYIVPLDLVREAFEIRRETVVTMDSTNVINLRGEALPFMRLREFFGEDDGAHDTECVLVVEYMRRKVGIVVDSPMGEFQTVIKPLGAVFRELTWVSGATILGTGEVALILDVPRLVKGSYFVGAMAS